MYNKRVLFLTVKCTIRRFYCIRSNCASARALWWNCFSLRTAVFVLSLSSAIWHRHHSRCLPTARQRSTTMHSAILPWQFRPSVRQSVSLSVLAATDGSTRLAASRPSYCTQRSTLSVINSWRSSVELSWYDTIRCDGLH